ncbi:hypothetical protein [Rhizobium sp. RCAM05973]|uniref:hypothetical protein n=1 Tax=Rhizobium sp. RCAM05973 TaxID=2994066 RepID=UPI0022EBA9AD|nr:hypothetical protein [Rhizobium sp. RCAM05973]
MQGVIQTNGTSVLPGEWLHIKFADVGEYVGRFSGLYENPTLGLMYYLSYARPIDCSESPTTLFCSIREANSCGEALDNAVPIQKPQKRKGKLVISPKIPDGAVFH